MNFLDQVVIVTGGTRGIGRGVTEAFLKQGATCIATYVGNTERAESFKHELGSLGEKLILKKFDVSKEKEVEAFYLELDQVFSQIHVLVNNSGIRQDALVPSMTGEMWQRVIDVNLTGSFLMSKYAVLRMMKSRYGRIINMSSIGGTIGLAGQANYAATKAGVVAMSKSLAKEVGKRGITVNNVCPGFIDTELIADLPSDQVEEYKKQVPLKRFGTVQEVAAAVLFLASKEASYITAASLDITGGL